MLVDASLREADLHRVKPNQRAVVTLDAFPDSRLSGRVISVGAVAKLSTARPFDGKRFDVIVELDPTHLDLRPEMTARIDITVADRQQVLLVPVTAVFERAGAHVVHVVHGGRIEVRPVTLGQSDDMRVEIAGGLRGDERVRLIDDADKSTDPVSGANAPASRTP
jgi:multidrug efflux pump subunit AcrA (membrane-fusion protein)